MRRVRILAEASDEALEAAGWYDNQRAGLGAEFAQAVEAALDVIEGAWVPLTPVPGVSGARGAKRLLLSRFPYSIVVRETAVELVVVAIAHHSRRPGYWRRRT